jgi:threonine dehydrogenase-like Zn-dependent dehydrogenase
MPQETKRMKAAVLYKARDIRVEEVETPKLQTAGDVLIRVKASGICGSDLHTYRLAPPADPGQIMGHEYSGEVAEIGSDVQGLEVGDPVVAVSFGANAEYIRIPREGRGIIVPLPETVSFEEAATIEPLANSVHIANLADPSDDDTIVVMGAGIIGLGTIQALKGLSSARVIAIDHSDFRLSMARKLGAEITINAGKEDPYTKVLEITGATPVAFMEATPAGKVDTVCDCAGWLAGHTGTPPVQQGLQMLRPQGKLVEHSIFEKPPQIDFFALARKEIRLQGSWGFTHAEYLQALEMIRSGKVDRKPLITHEFPLEEASKAFETQLEYGEAIKILLKP